MDENLDHTTWLSNYFGRRITSLSELTKEEEVKFITDFASMALLIRESVNDVVDSFTQNLLDSKS